MILLTGATGFIGRRVLARMLRSYAPEEIRVLLMEQEKDFVEDYPGIAFTIGDLSNENAISEAVKDASVIIHLASKNIDRDGTGFIEINVEGTRKLCKAAEDQNVKTFIYLSSVGVYGHGAHRDADEATKPAPDTPFSESKASAEQVVLEYNAKGAFNGVVLRHRYVYGEGDVHVVPRMINAAKKYKFMLDKGKAMISFIQADDVAEIVFRFSQIEEAEKEPVYHITDGHPVRYRDIIGLFCETYNLERPTKNVPLWLILPLIRLKEILTNTDPEKTKSSLSSIRLKLVGYDNSFSNAKLKKRFPDLQLKSFEENFANLKEYYAQFLNENE